MGACSGLQPLSLFLTPEMLLQLVTLPGSTNQKLKSLKFKLIGHSPSQNWLAHLLPGMVCFCLLKRKKVCQSLSLVQDEKELSVGPTLSLSIECFPILSLSHISTRHILISYSGFSPFSKKPSALG